MPTIVTDANEAFYHLDHWGCEQRDAMEPFCVVTSRAVDNYNKLPRASVEQSARANIVAGMVSWGSSVRAIASRSRPWNYSTPADGVPQIFRIK